MCWRIFVEEYLLKNICWSTWVLAHVHCMYISAHCCCGKALSVFCIVTTALAVSFDVSNECGDFPVNFLEIYFPLKSCHDLLNKDENKLENNPLGFSSDIFRFLGFGSSCTSLGSKPFSKTFSASFSRLTGNFWWCMLGTIRLNFWICGLKDFLRCFVDNAFF